MKGILEFALPEDQEEFNMATKAVDYSLVLYDLDQFLRAKIKYEELTDEQYKIYDEIRSKLHELARERDVSLI